jgi:alcohol dehydrogenase (NADP+)
VDQFLSLEQAPIAATWKKMEEYVQEGLCKHIGVSNFSIKKLEDLMKTAKIKPEMNQIEANPYFQQVKLIEFCQSHNIHITAYAPLGSNKNSSTNSLLKDSILISIAEKHNCTAAQVVLSWGIHRNTVVIPKSAHAERIRSNFKSQEVKLDKEDMNSIAKLERNNRLTTGDGWTGIEGSPYTFKELWNE